MVCPTCYDPRHPQETIRIRPERQVPWARPEPADVEIVVGPADPDALGRISSGVPDGFLAEAPQDGFYSNEADGMITRNTQE